MSNCVDTPHFIFLHFFSFVSYVFVNIADIQIIKILHHTIWSTSLGINLVQNLVIYGSETHLREVPIYVKSRIVTS